MKPATMTRPRRSAKKRIVVTGGAGFIGTNLVHGLAVEEHSVLVYDDLSRPGVETNLRWLRSTHGREIEVELGSVTDARRLRRALRGADAVFHLAAQVAVTTSVDDPEADFAVNLRGTLNVLEALRALKDPPHLVFTSTNKVYGGLDDLGLEEDLEAYRPRSSSARCGISEARRLDFHTPYGCSKGGADQYILDYARTFGLPTTVFRMSCIYGPHQHGTEDQGWVAHFMIRALQRRPIIVFGNGKQVRDVLYVSDLVEAFLLALRHPRKVVGKPFNIGGGPGNALSPLELLDRLDELQDAPPTVSFEGWRTGDQRWYVSDTSAFHRATGWRPRTTKADGLRRLYEWLRSNASEPEWDETEEEGSSAVAAAR